MIEMAYMFIKKQTRFLEWILLIFCFSNVSVNLIPKGSNCNKSESVPVMRGGGQRNA